MEVPATSASANPAHAYRDIYERGAVDAAFFWHLRSLAVERPQYTCADLALLEHRLDARLDLLMSSLDLGWDACEAALTTQQAGEVFTATVIALRSHDIGKIKTAIQSGLAAPAAFKALVSALGWLPGEIARPWTERLLKGKDMNHKYLGVAACSVRREDPGELLNEILKRDDCRQHAKLYARTLRLVGELRRQDLMPTLQTTMASKDPALVFWASWSSILLGRHASVNNLRPYVLQAGPYRARAIQLAFRVLPVEQGREWISALAQDPANLRAVVRATGVLGDPHAVNWLIDKMTDTKLARLAGEAFHLITGVDLQQHDLTRPPLANDDPDANDIDLDEDDDLPWPDPERIAAGWRNQGRHFLVGRRYFLGKAIAPEWLKQKLNEGTQRQRHAAALELALIDPQSRLVNTRAKVRV